MRVYSFLFLFCCLFFFVSSQAQRIIYSEPEGGDNRRMNFEIVGKVSGNFLVHKNTGNKNAIAVYDNEMEQIHKEDQNYLADLRLINVEFFPYADFAYMVYQYQKKKVVYCEAVKIDGKGKKISEIMRLDTSHIGLTATNRIYSTISSENKSHLMLYKINSRNKSNYLVTTMLFDDKLEPVKRSRFVMPMDDYNETLNEFSLDNDGDLVFAKVRRTGNETIVESRLYFKSALTDELTEVRVPQQDMYLDEPFIKVDNLNKRYFLTSFFYRERRGNIQGFYFYVWDKQTRTVSMENAVLLEEEIRMEARGDAGMKTAFNDFFIRNIIIKKGGGFLINTEAYYTTSRFTTWNRYNRFGTYTPYDYTVTPYNNSWWWRNRSLSNQAIRHHSDNVMILSFDQEGKLQWNSVIRKTQYDDESDDRISFLITNTGGQLHYLFNTDEKSAYVLNDLMLSPDGKINNNHALKNLDRGYEFLPKYGKQVSSYQTIIPCYYRNYICFAKIEFN